MFNSMGFLIGVVCGSLFICLLLVLGFYFIRSSFKSRQKAGESQQWPTTSGQIVEARVTSSITTDADGDTSVSYEPFVSYAYKVNEKEYTSNQMTFGFKRTYSKEMNAHKALDRYPLWSSVNVYYNPANPEEAVLERTATGSTLTLIFGIIFVSIGACVIFAAMGYFFYFLLSTQ